MAHVTGEMIDASVGLLSLDQPPDDLDGTILGLQEEARDLRAGGAEFLIVDVSRIPYPDLRLAAGIVYLVAATKGRGCIVCRREQEDNLSNIGLRHLFADGQDAATWCHTQREETPDYATPA